MRSCRPRRLLETPGRALSMGGLVTDDQRTEQGPPANADVSPRRRPRWRPGRRVVLAAAALGVLLLVSAGGAAYATYDYSRDYEGRILPGTTVAGVDVGGLSADEALAAVRDAIRPELTRVVRVKWGDRTWKLTPKKIGARSDAARAVDAAMEASAATSFFDKMQMRLLGEGLDFRRAVAIRYPREGAKGFVEGIAASVDREVRDAAVDYSSGWVEIVPERSGRRVDVGESHRRLMKALRSGESALWLKVKTIEPETTTDSFDQVLLVRIGENKLYLYQNGTITHTWTIATGQPEYMTPTGIYSVTEKRYMPTWVNPAPDTWGASMPAEIPPGPGNPLGVRAINWSAPAIRFHGTSATYSLGYNASHGCVRLSNADVIQLYDLIDVGTPIVSLVAGPLKPLYSSSPDPTPIAEDDASGEATAIQQQSAGATAGAPRDS